MRRSKLRVRIQKRRRRLLLLILKAILGTQRPPAPFFCVLLHDLIPVNPVKERDFKRSGNDRIADFKKLLEKNRINVTIRRGMGKNIDAACGQLRRSYMNGEADIGQN